ncbi:hypothetical protein [Bacillus rubiinfantis]|uniref:hypothetical protein n=1 Tax=Bacillus rubiinfantis TaxID=1499680 RepID=UPI00165245F3|nr:hypothetical protein [Bacillus rubiinfantis]
MQEKVNVCHSCGKKLFCLGGFFNGVILENKQTYCFDCYDYISKDEKNPQN